MSVLLLVRHGQASFGEANYDQLSGIGAEQARLLGDRLRSQAGNIRTVISGGMERQRETARLVLDRAGRPDVAVRIDPRWDEYDTDDVLKPAQGDFAVYSATTDQNQNQDQNQDPRRAFQARLDEALARWTGGTDDGLYRETWPSFRGRVSAALRDAGQLGGLTVVFTSGGAISAACSNLLGAPAPVWARLQRTMVNSGVTKAVFGRSGASLVTVNDHGHLEGARSELLTYR